jgi:CHAT domain-containing protein
MQKSGKNGTGPIVFANPLYDRQENPRGAQLPEKASGRGPFDFSNVKFLPLSGTAEEAKALSTIIRDVKVVVGAQATEESLKKVIGPRILHVATHGFFLPDEKEKPGQKQGSRQLQFTIGDSTKAAPGIDNPLLRSGLALAGANQRQGGADEDGILTALEVAGLDLAGTELVVLSACETGLGDVRNGDGVYGLRRTLVIAGAKSQVMSLWQVSDAATRDLMVEYYKRLQAHEGAGEALRKVQLEMLQSSERSHPFYWASFIQSGDWRSLNSR